MRQLMLSTGGGCTILADDIVSQVRFELPRSLPTSFDTRVGQPADDTPDRMAHHVRPSMVVRPLALRLHKYWSRSPSTQPCARRAASGQLADRNTPALLEKA
jgi:hypothetical protein